MWDLEEGTAGAELVFEVQATSKKQFTVIVEPRAFEGEHEVGDERLPGTARARARALSDEIRARSRPYEAPM
jgi:hypothetical protein